LVSLVEDFRSEDASNNWLLWMPCPAPTEGEIELAARQEEVPVGRRADEIERLRLTDRERYAAAAALRSLERTLYADPENLGGEHRDMQRDAAILRGLLERTE
jgi:hypothetical protein